MSSVTAETVVPARPSKSPSYRCSSSQICARENRVTAFASSSGRHLFAAISAVSRSLRSTGLGHRVCAEAASAAHWFAPTVGRDIFKSSSSRPGSTLYRGQLGGAGVLDGGLGGIARYFEGGTDRSSAHRHIPSWRFRVRAGWALSHSRNTCEHHPRHRDREFSALCRWRVRSQCAA